MMVSRSAELPAHRPQPVPRERAEVVLATAKRIRRRGGRAAPLTTRDIMALVRIQGAMDRPRPTHSDGVSTLYPPTYLRNLVQAHHSNDRLIVPTPQKVQRKPDRSRSQHPQRRARKTRREPHKRLTQKAIVCRLEVRVISRTAAFRRYGHEPSDSLLLTLRFILLTRAVLRYEWAVPAEFETPSSFPMPSLPSAS